MDRIQDYNHRKAYVELALANMLKAKRGFDYIKYRKVQRTDEEFIRIGDLRGCTVTFNVTASPLSEIMEIVCDYVVSGPGGKIVRNNIVVDDEKLLYIAPLFKEVA